jgi:hypothetical protein
LHIREAVLWRKIIRNQNFLARFDKETGNTDEGDARVVRHGHLPDREVMTGIGYICPITVH